VPSNHCIQDKDGIQPARKNLIKLSPKVLLGNAGTTYSNSVKMASSETKNKAAVAGGGNCRKWTYLYLERQWQTVHPARQSSALCTGFSMESSASVSLTTTYAYCVMPKTFTAGMALTRNGYTEFPLFGEKKPQIFQSNFIIFQVRLIIVCNQNTQNTGH